MRAPIATAILISTMATAHGAGLIDCGLWKSDCSDLIGKRAWVVVPRENPNTVEVTQVPGDWSNTEKLRTGSFLIKGVTPDKHGGYLFRVGLPTGKSGYVASSNWIFLTLTDPVEAARKSAAAAQAAKEECERRGQPKIGMTEAEATATCWGTPRRIQKVTTGSGVRKDYIYSAGHVLQFEGEKLSTILETAGR